MRRRTLRLLAAAVVAAFAALLGGCVYLRLLELKQQIASFDRNFAVATEDGVRIDFLDPVLLSDDLLWMGLAPESVRRIGSAELWNVRWVKQLPPEVREQGEYDIVVALQFSRNRLTRVSIPERYFAVMPKTLLLDLLRSLGGAKVDRDSRSIEAQLAAARPDLPDIEKLLGRPTSEVEKGDETIVRYRYVPSTRRKLARSAVFDMAVHFDTKSGEMRRWQGQTPVGKVGFRFEGK